jgi:hypothetical protein
MQHAAIQGVFLIALFLAGGAYGECTDRDKQTLRDSGMSEYKIDQLCGVVQDRPEVKEEVRVLPKRPNTHGRLQELTNICQTELMWCTLDQEGPPGTPCVCQSSYGPQKGVLVAR